MNIHNVSVTRKIERLSLHFMTFTLVGNREFWFLNDLKHTLTLNYAYVLLKKCFKAKTSFRGCSACFKGCQK